MQLRKDDAPFGDLDVIAFDLRDDGVLQGSTAESGIPIEVTATLGYDPDAHGTWRIAEVGDEVVFSVSANGVTFSEVGRTFSPSWVRSAYFSLEARSGTAGNAQVRVRRINPGRVQAPFCPVSSLVTDLGGNRFEQFTEVDGAECSLFQEGDGISFRTVAGGVASSCSLRTRTAYAIDQGAVIGIADWNLDDNSGGSLAVADIFAYLALVRTPKANTPTLTGALPRALAEIHVTDGNVHCFGNVDGSGAASVAFSTAITNLSVQRSGDAIGCRVTTPSGAESLAGGASSISFDAAFVELGITKAAGVGTDTSFKVSTLGGF